MKQVVCVFLCFLLVACASSSRRNIQMTYDEKAPFDTYRTFTIEPVQNVKQYSGLNKMIISGIESTLSSKGLSYTQSEDSDLVVRFATKIDRSEQLKLEQISTGKGVFIRNQMEPVNEGSLLVNIIDRKADRVVWKASSISDITGVNLDTLTQVRIDEAMTEVFEDYPTTLF